MRNKALILVQGISSKEDYIQPQLKAAGFPLGDYALVKTVETEKFFDKNTPWYIKPFKLGPTKEWADKIADVLAFMGQKDGRVGACRKVRHEIQRATQDGYDVEVAAHSLGTIITLTCGPNDLIQTEPIKEQVLYVSKTYLFNSPMGMIFPFGGKVLDFVRRYIQNYITKEIIYVYGSKDLVSKNYSSENHGQILNLATIGYKQVQKEEVGHSLEKTAKAWVERIG